MINFEISYDDLKHIFKALAPAVSKNHHSKNVAHTYIRFRAKDGGLTACAVDGFRLHSISVPISTDEEFEFLLKPFTLSPKQCDFLKCTLSSNELFDELSFDFGNRRIIEMTGSGEFVDTDAAMAFRSSNPIKIALNAKYIMDAVKTLSDRNDDRSPIVMEIRSPLTPVIMYKREDKDNFRMVLPVRIKDDL